MVEIFFQLEIESFGEFCNDIIDTTNDRFSAK